MEEWAERTEQQVCGPVQKTDNIKNDLLEVQVGVHHLYLLVLW